MCIIRCLPAGVGVTMESLLVVGKAAEEMTLLSLGPFGDGGEGVGEEVLAVVIIPSGSKTV